MVFRAVFRAVFCAVINVFVGSLANGTYKRDKSPRMRTLINSTRDGCLYPKVLFKIIIKVV